MGILEPTFRSRRMVAAFRALGVLVRVLETGVAMFVVLTTPRTKVGLLIEFLRQTFPIVHQVPYAGVR